MSVHDVDLSRLNGLPSEEAERLLHQLRQPLNVMRLATANIRSRISPALQEDERDYLDRKLERIEKQIERTAQIAEAILAGQAPT